MRYWISVMVILIVGISGCGDNGGDGPVPFGQENSEQGCTEGETKCEDDGVYECNADGEYQLSEECDDCEGGSDAFCPGACEEGMSSICEGDSLRNCATDEVESCYTGQCIMDGDTGVCVAASGTKCRGTSEEGTSFELLCGDEEGIADDLICDLRSDECQPSTFDCGALSGVPTDGLACDTSGNFLTGCVDDQPQGLICEGDSSCGADDSFNCYTEAQAGTSCGGSTVCYPGLHCRQSGPDAASCSQPAGQLACSNSDILSICVDSDTALACVEGAVFWWDDITSWGGSCSGNTPVIPEGGTCIPGLADCAQGLVCNKSVYDIAGVCETPEPDAPAECTLTNQASTGNSCSYAWTSCLDGNQYGIACQAQSVGGQVITICSCYENGAETKGGIAGAELCGVETLDELDELAAENCEWDVVTVDVAP